MKPPEETIRELVRQWLSKADQDLAAAQILLQSNPLMPGVVGFHAQQAAEKYLKAFLVWQQIDFPKTHNIGALLVLVCVEDEVLAASLKPSLVLSNYAVEQRYPGDLPELSTGEAETALELAGMVGAAIRTALRDAT